MKTENTCTECGMTKPISCFNKHAGMASGYYNQCRPCMSQSQRNRRHSRKAESPLSDLMNRWGRPGG